MAVWWEQFLTWMRDNQIGDLSGIFGVLTSVLGFGATIITLIKTKNAAERAETASKETKESIKLFETITDFTSAIHILEDVRRIHRSEQWILLPDRYSAIRKILIPMLSREQLNVDQIATINEAIDNLKKMETSVEKALSSQGKLKSTTFNTILLRDTDNLLKILSEIKVVKIGV